MAFKDPLASGTITLFRSTTAITGWTKQTTYHDYTIRVVSASGGVAGGSVPFTTVFTNVTPSGTFPVTGTTGSTTLSVPQLPQHQHGPFMSAPFDNPYPGYSTIWYVPSPSQPANKYLGYFAVAYTYMSSSTAAAPATYVGPGASTTITVSPTGLAAAGHSHSFTSPGSGAVAGTALNFNVKYVDVILAKKD